MNLLAPSPRRFLFAVLLGGFVFQAALGFAQSGSAAGTNEIVIYQLEGIVEVSPRGASTWVKTQTNQVLHPHDRLRTTANSRVKLLWSDNSVVPLGALTEIEILPPDERQGFAVSLLKGILSFFHRDTPGRMRVITRGAVAGIEGTEFVISIEETNGIEVTRLSLIDGKVRFSNDQGLLNLTSGEEAVAEPGKRPVRTAGFIVNNVLQWCFYYPAVLDLDELPLSPEEQQALAGSLAAYRSGDLLQALAKYPEGRQPSSDAEKLYYAALQLSVGNVEQTVAALGSLSGSNASAEIRRLADALGVLISAVKLETNRPAPSQILANQTATELLAASYYQQSLAIREVSLNRALALARQAAVKSPRFGFAWARIAELEFSFGRTRQTLEALNTALALTPRNAEALSLKGFLLAAQNKPREAIAQFNQAIAVDSALGNAWLGRGLCRIRLGDQIGGREDLLIAAASEPQRALLRSYLGKAYAHEGDFPHADKELARAKDLDPNDPTSWLYSALLKQQQNRINEAIRDLEKSEELNDNRSLYRSQLLLDQDRAVRSANLAAIYRDAGMFDVSVREASRAVNYDYANYSAHLFLANSYNELRDPNRINLRYETPAESEYLMANLLAPVGAGTLSPAISQQEYSKLFERDRFGLVSSTEYLSRGAWTEEAVQYGTFGDKSYAVEAFYHSDPGQRPNNDFEDKALSVYLKQALSASDTVFAQFLYRKAERGDLAQYFDPSYANRGARSTEEQNPIVVAGYHHEWAPGVHTLILGTRLDDKFSVSNPTDVTLFVSKDGGVPDFVAPIFVSQKYSSRLQIYSAEVQQIFEVGRSTTVFGSRYQNGDFDTHNLQTGPSDYFLFFVPDEPAAAQHFVVPFERTSFYGYEQLRVFEQVLLAGGVSYDRILFPQNFRAAPLSADQERRERVSPKVGIIWTPDSRTSLRAAYTRSLAGASIDQSYELEPSQIAGFNQSFRSIMPESVGGAFAGAEFETAGLSVERRIGVGTYLGITAERLRSKVEHTAGVFDLNDPLGFASPSGTREHIDYEDDSLLVTINQIVGKEWALGGRYRLSKATLNDNFAEVPRSAYLAGGFRPHQELEATLGELDLYTIYNHASGFFARFDGLWYSQSNGGYSPNLGGDDFWQFNLQVGYRFPGRRAQLQLGVLNITDRDYRLNPLTLYNDLPRKRTFALRMDFSF